MEEIDAQGPEPWSNLTGDQARDAVFLHLAKQVRRFPRLDLTGPELPASADPRDAALAHAINDAVVRRWTTLERLIAKKAKKPLASIDPPVRAALLAGAAQVLLFDRIPAHAAVNHAVQWTKLNVNNGAGGFVNAVLHRICEALGERTDTPAPLPADWTTARNVIPLSTTEARILTEDLLPEEADRRTAVALGMPLGLLNKFVASFGPETGLGIAFASMGNAPTILNTAHAKLPIESADLVPHEQPGHVVFQGSHADLSRLLKGRPDVWAQDPASSHTLTFATKVMADAGITPKRMLDLCAGQGTKTRQLAGLFKDAQIVATETEDRRLAVLSAHFHGSPQVRVVRLPEIESIAALEPFDAILLDVPCSNTGVLSRRPEARHRFSEESVKELVGVQRQIIKRAVGLLPPVPAPCVIVYATCSLDARENQAQVDWACAEFGLKLLAPAVTTVPISSPVTSARDGAFVAVLTR